MAILQVMIMTGRPTTYLTSNFQQASGGSIVGRHSYMNALTNYLTGAQTGTESFFTGTYQGTTQTVAPFIQVTVPAAQVQASGTLTFVSAVATNTFKVNGVTFTAVNSGATGNQFNIGVSDTLTAAAAAAAIVASATSLVSGYVTATSALGVVTVTAIEAGQFGNTVTIEGSANITASGARLTGFVQDANQTTFTF